MDGVTVGRPRAVATVDDGAEPEALARPARRGEADRAGAVLLSAAGWTSGEIARAFGAAPDSVRRWRTWRNRLACAGFMAEGVDGLRANPQARANRFAVSLEQHRSRARRPWLWRARFCQARWWIGRTGPCRGCKPNWRCAAGSRSPRRSSARRRKRGFRWRRPRHCLHGRQDAQAADWSGLGLRLLRQQAVAGNIVLLFGDGSEVLAHPHLAHAWAKRGADLRVPAPGQARKRALLSVLDYGSGELAVHVSASKRGSDFVALLEKLGHRYGPKLGRTAMPVVSAQPVGFALALDHGPIHASKLACAAIAERPWLTVKRRPKHTPELNDIERSWRGLKRHFLARRPHRIRSSSKSPVSSLPANTLEPDKSHPSLNHAVVPPGFSPGKVGACSTSSAGTSRLCHAPGVFRPRAHGDCVTSVPHAAGLL